MSEQKTAEEKVLLITSAHYMVEEQQRVIMNLEEKVAPFLCDVEPPVDRTIAENSTPSKNSKPSNRSEYHADVVLLIEKMVSNTDRLHSIIGRFDV